jgi:hypothetical protein
MDIKKLIQELTIDEKISLLCGKDSWHTNNIDRLNIRSVTMNDGPHGLRIPLDEGGSIPATCFPPAATFACCYDNELVEQIGQAIAKEYNTIKNWVSTNKPYTAYIYTAHTSEQAKNEIDSIYSDNKENFGNFLADSENFQYVDFTLYEEENGFSNKKVIKE